MGDIEKPENQKILNLDDLEELPGGAFHSSPPLFSVIGVLDRIMLASFKWNTFVEKNIPQLSGNRLRSGIYQGWVLRLEDTVDRYGIGNTTQKMINDYLAIVPVNDKTLVAGVQRINDHIYDAYKTLILDMKHYKVRLPDIKQGGLGYPAACYDRISGLKGITIKGI